MSSDDSFVEISASSLSLSALVERVEDDEAGAVATFSGNTRNSFQGKGVLKLEYEAYEPMAKRKLQERISALCPSQASGSKLCSQNLKCPCLQEICKACKTKFDVMKIAIAHRIGTVKVGETSVIIAVSSAHRRAALEVSSKYLNYCSDLNVQWLNRRCSSVSKHSESGVTQTVPLGRLVLGPLTS